MGCFSNPDDDRAKDLEGRHGRIDAHCPTDVYIARGLGMRMLLSFSQSRSCTTVVLHTPDSVGRFQYSTFIQCQSAIMSVGLPIKLLNEAEGHVVSLELSSGAIYRGKLLEGACSIPIIPFQSNDH